MKRIYILFAILIANTILCTVLANTNDTTQNATSNGSDPMTLPIASYKRNPILFSSPRLAIKANGLIGLGTTDPSYALHIVNGDIFLNKTIGGSVSVVGRGRGAILFGTSNSNGKLWRMEYLTRSGESGLSISTNSNNLMLLDNGNVGIGTTSPQYKLDLNGEVYLRRHETIDKWGYSYLYWSAHSLVMGTPPGTYANNSIDLRPGGHSSGPIFSRIRMYTATGENQQKQKIEFCTIGHSWFNHDGNLGIGTTTPAYKLDVVGTIRAEEILVNLNAKGGADFVFDTDYDLPSLDEVQSFIQENKHLPEIPSAKEMHEEGINVNELQIRLLQKIEELTLYIIQQNKQIKSLQTQINNLQNK